MTLPVEINPLLLAQRQSAYQISRSVRLRSSASANFTKTNSTPTSANIYTYSFWVKRGTLGVLQEILSKLSATNDWFRFDSGDTLSISIGGTTLTSTAVFRDPGAWYHIVLSLNSTAVTVSVNNVAVITGTATPGSNGFNTNGNAFGLGGDSGAYFDGYMTEVNLVDGQALAPSSFGEYDTVTGVWKPKRYTGAYGNNGAYLNFSDNSASTAATIGKDYSGNGNNWTPNNVSVTAGATYDSMLDVPTNWADGSGVRGNYPCITPLATSSVSGTTTIDGNLVVSQAAGTARRNFVSSMALPQTGKWYMEIRIVSATVRGFVTGIWPADTISAYIDSTNMYTFCRAGARVLASSPFTWQSVVIGSVGSSIGLTEPVAGDIVQIKFDADTGSLEIGKNNTFVTIVASGITGQQIFAFSKDATSSSLPLGIAANFGQQPFVYTPPTGYAALNTQNLPDATIKKGAQYFDATLYTGNGSTQSVSGSNFAPDLVWIKGRSGATSHALYDSVRGVQLELTPDGATVETVQPTGLTAFNAAGFSIGSLARLNTNLSTYVAWLWKEGSAQGLDILKYTGTGSNQTIAHNLGVAPSMIIVKPRDSARDWIVYHKNLGAGSFIALNLTSAVGSSTTAWNNTLPTSSVFSVGTSTGTNLSGSEYIAYLFAEISGFSKLGSYVGNGSANGPFVYCGFRPKYILMKRTNDVADWVIFDTSRSVANIANLTLFSDTAGAEVVSTINQIDILSNGFKVRDSGAGVNISGNTYIFAAFAENPFKYSLAR